MKIASLDAKTIFGITSAIVIVAVISYFSDWFLFLPALIGFLILIKFGKDGVSSFIGLLILKPIISTFLGSLPSSKIFESFSYLSNEVLSAFLWIVPELLLTLILVRAYRYLFNSNRTVWLFLIGDSIRWFGMAIVLLLPDPFPDPYFYPQLYALVFFAVFYPHLYAIVGLINVIRHANNNKAVAQMTD